MSEERLVCLAQTFANIEFMGCRQVLFQRLTCFTSDGPQNLKVNFDYKTAPPESLIMKPYIHDKTLGYFIEKLHCCYSTVGSR